MTSLTKNPNPPSKNFFQVQTRRLAESFESLNSSLPLSVPELGARKAMCDLYFLAQNPQNRPDAKVLKTLGKCKSLL